MSGEEIEWKMVISAVIIGAVTATFMLFPVWGILGIIGVAVDIGFNTGNLPLDITGILLAIIWLVGFAILSYRLYQKQIPSEVAGDGLVLAAKLSILALPLILIAMFISDFPMSVGGILSWIIPPLFLALVTGGPGWVLRRRARRKLAK